jgi:hypothetical protein
MNCATRLWPIKYLGVPVSGARLHVRDWIYLDEKIMKRLDGWQVSGGETWTDPQGGYPSGCRLTNGRIGT